MMKLIRVRLRRPCNICEKMFVPTGRTNRICPKCSKQAMLNRRKKKSY